MAGNSCIPLASISWAGGVAENAYASYLGAGSRSPSVFLFLLTLAMKYPNPSIDRAPTMAPTAIPAFAPADSAPLVEAHDAVPDSVLDIGVVEAVPDSVLDIGVVDCELRFVAEPIDEGTEEVRDIPSVGSITTAARAPSSVQQDFVSPQHHFSEYAVPSQGVTCICPSPDSPLKL